MLIAFAARTSSLNLLPGGSSGTRFSNRILVSLSSSPSRRPSFRIEYRDQGYISATLLGFPRLRYCNLVQAKRPQSACRRVPAPVDDPADRRRERPRAEISVHSHAPQEGSARDERQELSEEPSFSIKDLGAAIVKALGLKPNDEIEILRDKLDVNRILVRRHANDQGSAT